MSEIVLFGATGYTGALTAKAMVARGLKPVLAGRNRSSLEALANQLGGLPVRIADVADPQSVYQLVKEGDVLVSTVGPFARWGSPALDAALAAKAHYLDSTGEPAFVRRVFEQYNERARQNGRVFLPAFGYDYVPGNTVAAAALERAGSSAVRVDVGYFVGAGKSFNMSQGTFASLAGAMADPGVFFNQGKRSLSYGGLRTRKFSLDGQPIGSMSVPGSECLALPSSYPSLRDVNVYLGWFGNLSSAISVSAHVQRLMLKVPGYKRLLDLLVTRLGSSGRGPNETERAAEGSHIIAEAFDASGQLLATAELRGVNGYTYTANMLAWGAQQAAEGRAIAAGALGPVEAFGLPALVEGNREAGLILN
ncbi:conserved hypothetical protein [gamma proteobacterium HdN1]|nr:conserved hypothetical protein [gamma proteobacterium HdN1]